MATLGNTRYGSRNSTLAPPETRRRPAGTTARPAPRTTPRPATTVRERTDATPLQNRAFACCAVIALLYAALAGRLYYLQVHKHAEFNEMASEWRQVKRRLDAPRGAILDRAGTLLVQNDPAATIVVDPNRWVEISSAPRGKLMPPTFDQLRLQTLNELKALYARHEGQMPETDLDKALAPESLTPYTTKNGKTRYRTIDLTREVPLPIAEEIKAAQNPPREEQNVRPAQFVGIGLFPDAKRKAINGNLAAHIVGFTGRDKEGLAGLESSLDGKLKGQSGFLRAELDPSGRPIEGTIRENRPAIAGRDVVLTIDAELQHAVEDALGRAYTKAQAESATAVVIDPKTGDVLAMANYPTYNVNHIRDAKAENRRNRAVSDPFEPGSTLKVMTVAAALEEKLVTPSTGFFCKGSMKLGRRTIHCAHGARHGSETLTDVIRNSCNIATAECAFKLSKERLHDYLTEFGFGERTGSLLPGESSGILSDAERWPQIQTANIAFGQGISVTALQLAAAYGVIANDGVYQKPRVLWGVRNPENNQLEREALVPGRRVLSSETAREMRTMLQAVVDSGTGTAARLNGYTAGGKTGTAQIAERRGYGSKHLASFIGMAPATDPQVVILVAVTAPKGAYYGGTVAGPVFKEIAERALLMRRVPRDKADEPKVKPTGKRFAD